MCSRLPDCNDEGANAGQTHAGSHEPAFAREHLFSASNPEALWRMWGTRYCDNVKHCECILDRRNRDRNASILSQYVWVYWRDTTTHPQLWRPCRGPIMTIRCAANDVSKVLATICPASTSSATSLCSDYQERQIREDDRAHPPNRATCQRTERASPSRRK